MILKEELPQALAQAKYKGKYTISTVTFNDSEIQY